NDTVRQAPRPKLGIVPPATPVAADEDSEDDAGMSSGPGLSLDMVEDEVETAVRQAVAAHDGRLGNAADATDADSLEDVTALSSARLQAASLAAASERRTDAVRDTVADVSAMAATHVEDDVPAAARLEPVEAMASAQAAPMPVASTSAAEVSAEADEPADYLGEFDEDEFASELLDRAGLFEAGRADADVDVATDSVADDGAEDEGREAEEAPAMTAPPSPQAYEPAESKAKAADAVEAPATPSAPVAATTAADIHALVSHEAGERIAGSFDDLARVIRDEQMRTMDETVRQMLRPMLQEWLDDNLPRLVERLVREEIERVARGGRR
ncbi:MAG: DUF2497 domain-containing protein, partial [Aurantimonas coralicida]|nr:DUF2497 domain-containing protein [Aurantimonas coralicida]